MNKLLAIIGAASLALSAQAQQNEVELTLLETSDVHGNYLPYDFINGEAGAGSLARVMTYTDKLCKETGRDHVILLENGDILQGQPTAYYYNFIDTTSTHLCADILNYMQYDAGTVGNHDIETGHAVYDRWVKQCNFPMLGANAVETATGKPYWKPYTIIERKGIKIAVMGMVTPGIPMWLPQNLWSGLTFTDMTETARRYMPEMKAQADVIVGLFHSGVGKEEGVNQLAENAALHVAKSVSGFDVVFCGHDHRRANRTILNAAGDSVLILNPAADAMTVAQAKIKLSMEGNKPTIKWMKGDLIDVSKMQPDPAFMKQFKMASDVVKSFTNRTIGHSAHEMKTLPAFFGPSAFIDFIHQMQLRISGADISFTAPLAFDACIQQGPIRVRDMFKLYRYENMLYVMELSGQEIKDYLEYSYAGWTNQMKNESDHLLLFKPNADKIKQPWQRMATPSYNFDSAAGIRYTVDVSKPTGEKICIESMADDSPFDLQKTYRCAINSYRGNGGGNLLTKGAGIKAEDLDKRIVWSTDKDLRYYLMKAIEEADSISPEPLNLWKFVPAAWTEKAKLRDMELLKQ